MDRTFGIMALAGFTLSLAAHVAALAGIDVAAAVPLVWALHVGMFVVFIPFVFSCRKVLGRRSKLAQLRVIFPGWVLAVTAALMVYALVNFLLFMMGTEGGNPSISGGKYVLLSHGRLIRELTATEYTAFEANVVRGFSGHWLIFYFVPFAYFMLRKKPRPAF